MDQVQGGGSNKIFDFCSYKTYRNMLLWARKLEKKEGIKENYITTFNTLNWGLFANIKNHVED